MRSLVLWFVLALAAPAYAQQAPMTENPQAQKQQGFRPSGFWTSPHPAKGGAYRWRMMAIGGGLLAATGFVMLRLVKKAGVERATRSRR